MKKMMDLVVPLDVAKEFKEIGVSQNDCYYYWFESGSSYGLVPAREGNLDSCYAAYTLCELIEKLPKILISSFHIYFLNISTTFEGDSMELVYEVSYKNKEVGYLVRFSDKNLMAAVINLVRWVYKKHYKKEDL